MLLSLHLGMKVSLFLLLCMSAVFAMPKKKFTILCLGDSYTIGEAAEPNERFAHQAVDMLQQRGLVFTEPKIIAKTGWTTDELSVAIKAQNLQGTFDVVTLLVGVNNQYRKRDTDNYRTEFRKLLQTALHYANNNPQHVFVISIPDWGVTPFALKDERSEQEIAKQIDSFNSINKQISQETGVHYIDITPGSRQAKHDSTLLAKDGLHPSGKMYKEWAILLADKMLSVFKN